MPIAVTAVPNVELKSSGRTTWVDVLVSPLKTVTPRVFPLKESVERFPFCIAEARAVANAASSVSRLPRSAVRAFSSVIFGTVITNKVPMIATTMRTSASVNPRGRD